MSTLLETGSKKPRPESEAKAMNPKRDAEPGPGKDGHDRRDEDHHESSETR